MDYTTQYYVRGHGKYYDEAGIIGPGDMPEGSSVYFYAPPGAAIAGNVADDIIRTGGYRYEIKLILRDRYKNDDTITNPRDFTWNGYPIRFTPREGYSTEAESFPMAGTKFLANWTLSGDDELNYDGLVCGVYEYGKRDPIITLGDREELQLSQLLAGSGGGARIVHWTACSSTYVKNRIDKMMKYTGYKVSYK